MTWNKRTISALIIGILSILVGIIFVEGNIGCELGDYPFWHVISILVPVIGGGVATAWSISETDVLGDLYGFWDYVKQFLLFLLPPAAVVLSIIAALLLVAIITGLFAVSVAVIVISAITGGGGIWWIIISNS